MPRCKLTRYNWQMLPFIPMFIPHSNAFSQWTRNLYGTTIHFKRMPFHKLLHLAESQQSTYEYIHVCMKDSFGRMSPVLLLSPLIWGKGIFSTYYCCYRVYFHFIFHRIQFVHLFIVYNPTLSSPISRIDFDGSTRLSFNVILYTINSIHMHHTFLSRRTDSKNVCAPNTHQQFT